MRQLTAKGLEHVRANEPKTKAVVSVAEMARMVGLIRARFYQLDRHDFPVAGLCVSTRRPFYDEKIARSRVLKFVAGIVASTASRSSSMRRRPVTGTPMRKPKQGQGRRKRQPRRSDRRAEGPRAGHGDRRPGCRGREGTIPAWGRWRSADGEVLRAVVPAPSPPEYER